MYNKNDIRTEYLEKRLELSSEQVLQKSQKICAQFKDLEELENARMIAFYLPIKNEVDTKQLIDDFIESGADICVPCFGSNKQNYSFCQFVAWDNLEPGPYGILQPKIARQVRVEQVDVVAVPSLAFDIHGYRLGYGKGVYDQLLNGSKTIRVGLAYDFQIMDKLPNEPHDLRMNFVVTEKKVYKFS